MNQQRRRFSRKLNRCSGILSPPVSEWFVSVVGGVGGGVGVGGQQGGDVMIKGGNIEITCDKMMN